MEKLLFQFIKWAAVFRGHNRAMGQADRSGSWTLGMGKWASCWFRKTWISAFCSVTKGFLTAAEQSFWQPNGVSHYGARCACLNRGLFEFSCSAIGFFLWNQCSWLWHLACDLDCQPVNPENPVKLLRRELSSVQGESVKSHKLHKVFFKSYRQLHGWNPVHMTQLGCLRLPWGFDNSPEQMTQWAKSWWAGLPGPPSFVWYDCCQVWKWRRATWFWFTARRERRAGAVLRSWKRLSNVYSGVCCDDMEQNNSYLRKMSQKKQCFSLQIFGPTLCGTGMEACCPYPS